MIANAKETGREAMIDFAGKRINSNSETLDKKIHNFSYPLSRMFHEVKPKKEMTKLGLCRHTELCLEGFLSSHTKERLTFRKYLLMSLQVYLWLLQIIVENQQGVSHACFRGARKSIERSRVVCSSICQ